MQQATADERPGLTHAHFVVDDLSATLAEGCARRAWRQRRRMARAYGTP
jgi:hypothetical protein